MLCLAALASASGLGDFVKGVMKVTSGTSSPKRTGGSAAVRGLGEEEEGAGSASDAVEDKREFGQLDRLDKKIPTTEEVEKFAKEGGLEG